MAEDHGAMAETGRAADEQAHDVLAAEAFAVPAPDPTLRHEPLVLPEDPTGVAEPHDILAAEEFAMPAGRPSTAGGVLSSRGGGSWQRLGLLVAAAAMLLGLAARRRGRL